jgi:hypothetical protein
MIGRAGRKGIDSIGESILMCNNPNEKRVGEELLKSQLTPIKSCLSVNMALSGSIKRAILEIVVSGVAQETNDLIKYASCTLLVQQEAQESSKPEQNDFIKQCLDWLIKNNFIANVQIKIQDSESKQIYKATSLGNAVLASAMAPDEGLVIFDELQKAMQCFVLENELQLIYEVTPINISEYWLNSASTIDWNFYLSVIEGFSSDRKRVANLVGVRESFIIKMIRGKPLANDMDKKLHKIHLRFYTALILNDLVNEVAFADLTDKYKCPKGFLQSLQQSSATYSGMITTFCNRLGWHSLELLVNQFQARLQFGVHRELCDLVRVSMLNSYRARLLYNMGYTNIGLLAKAEPQQLEKAFRSAMPFKKSTDSENFDSKCIWSDGKSYSNWEAAVAVIEEAKLLVKKEIESLGLRLADELEQTTRFGSQIKMNESKQAVDLEPIQDVVEKRDTSPQPIMVKPATPLKYKNLDTSKCLKTNRTPQKPNQIDEDVHDVSTSFLGLSLDDRDLVAAMDIIHQITSNKIETTQSSQQKIDNTSFLDDQKMVLLATEYDRKPVNEHIEPSQKPVDSTIISDDILQLCQKYERDCTHTPKTTENAQDKWKHLKSMQSPRLFCVEKQTKLTKTTVPVCTSSRIKSLAAVLPPDTIDSFCINEVNTENSFRELSMFLKSFKSVVSVSLAFDIRSNFSNDNNNQFKFMQNLAPRNQEPVKNENDFVYFDSEKSLNYKLQSILIGYNATATKRTHVQIIDLNRKLDCVDKSTTMSQFVKDLFENEALVKVLFFAKDQFKLLAKICNIEIKPPCYDPIVAYWLLENKIPSIHDIKQKYCLNFDIDMDENLKRFKHLYGSCNAESKYVWL